jgi:YHS domain-containing protein
MRLLAILALLAGLGGCAHAAKEGATATASQPADLVPPAQAKVGDRTRCIVSGDLFVVEEGSSYVEHEGQRYYVCCEHCVPDFQKDPAGLIRKNG